MDKEQRSEPGSDNKYRMVLHRQLIDGHQTLATSTTTEPRSDVVCYRWLDDRRTGAFAGMPNIRTASRQCLNANDDRKYALPSLSSTASTYAPNQENCE